MIVTGWTVFFVAFSLTTLKQYRCSGGLHSIGGKLMHKERWIIRLLVTVYSVISLLLASKFSLSAFSESGLDILVVTVGVAVFLISIVLYITARFAITSNCTWKGVFKTDRNKLIKMGPYKYIRHPEITAFFAAGIATGLILQDFRILVFMLFLLPMFYLTALIKEQYLKVIFPEYENYKSEAGMFF